MPIEISTKNTSPGGVDRDQIARNAEKKRQHVSHETSAEVSREQFGPYDPEDLPVCPICEANGYPFNRLRFEEGDAVCCSCWKRYPVTGGDA